MSGCRREMKRTRNKSRFPKDQDAEIGHVGYEWIDDDEVALSVDAAEAVNMRYFTSVGLCVNPRRISLT